MYKKRVNFNNNNSNNNNGRAGGSGNGNRSRSSGGRNNNQSGGRSRSRGPRQGPAPQQQQKPAAASSRGWSTAIQLIMTKHDNREERPAPLTTAEFYSGLPYRFLAMEDDNVPLNTGLIAGCTPVPAHLSARMIYSFHKVEYSIVGTNAKMAVVQDATIQAAADTYYSPDAGAAFTISANQRTDAAKRYFVGHKVTPDNKLRVLYMTQDDTGKRLGSSTIPLHELYGMKSSGNGLICSACSVNGGTISLKPDAPLLIKGNPIGSNPLSSVLAAINGDHSKLYIAAVVCGHGADAAQVAVNLPVGQRSEGKGPSKHTCASIISWCSIAFKANEPVASAKGADAPPTASFVTFE